MGLPNTLGAKAGGGLNVLFIVITVSACCETNRACKVGMADHVLVAMAVVTMSSSSIILASFDRVIKGTPLGVLLQVSHWCIHSVTFKDLFAVGLHGAMIARALDICWRVGIGVSLITLCSSMLTLCSTRCFGCNIGQGGGGVRMFPMWDWRSLSNLHPLVVFLALETLVANSIVCSRRCWCGVNAVS